MTLEHKDNRCISKKQLRLNNQMRLLFEQHVYWTRMTVISIVEGLADEGPVTMRLLRNASDMANAFGVFYGERAAEKLTRLFTDHLVIAAELVKAANAGDSEAAAAARARWYANGDDIVNFLSSLNPFWDREELREMWREHLRLTEAEAVARINRDFDADIALFDQIEQQALSMADEFTRGIVRQFSNMFDKC